MACSLVWGKKQQQKPLKTLHTQVSRQQDRCQSGLGSAYDEELEAVTSGAQHVQSSVGAASPS